MPTRSLNAAVFGAIHRHNVWGSPETASGPGSSRAATRELVPQLTRLLRALCVRRLVDAPCGDFNWMAPVAAAVQSYLGVDIVPALVETARARAANLPRAHFAIADLSVARLPRGDLYLVRDLLGHLSFSQARSVIRQVVRSGSTWLLTTTFPHVTSNAPGQTGAWRPLNLQLSPFRLPVPQLLLVEQPSRAPSPSWGRKCLGLWRLARPPASTA